jgi:hypothetical protein
MEKIFRGLQILLTYKRVDPDADWCCAAEHDIIYAHGPKKVTKEHATELDDLGWSWDSEFECWGHFT